MFLLLFFVILAFATAVSSGVDEDVTEPLSLSKVVKGIKAIKKLFQKPSDVGEVSFLLYRPTNSSSYKWEKIGSAGSSKLTTKNLKRGKPFKLGIHGFLATCQSDVFPVNVFRAYKNQFNMVCIEWGNFSRLSSQRLNLLSLLHYPKAVDNTLTVGNATACFMEALVSAGMMKGIGPSGFHLIGHSLGAHIAGIAGHTYYHRQKKKIGRITGLDPAGPAFYEKGKKDEAKLGKGDALFVEVIHTNMGNLGTDEHSGNVNFVVNKGVYQPFCRNNNVLKNIADRVSGMCSHMSAKRVYAKSIKTPLKACKCTEDLKPVKANCSGLNYVFLGANMKLKTKGTYCLTLESL